MDDAPHRVAIGLGANLGDRESALRAAITAIESIPAVDVTGVSTFHITAPVVPAAAEGTVSQPDYLNGAMTLQTSLAPRELLEELQRIERANGRVRRPADRWAARTLDLDLLLYDGLVLDEPGLTIPHPRMHERLFVLAPLSEIAPDWRHPIAGATVLEMRNRLRAGAAV